MTIVYYAHSKLINGTDESLKGRAAIEQLIPSCEILDPEFIPWEKLVSETAERLRVKHLESLPSPVDAEYLKRVDRLGRFREKANALVYENMIVKCDRLVVLEYLNHMGKGVTEEVWRALNHKKPVDVLRWVDGIAKLLPVSNWSIANKGDWKIKYASLTLAKMAH